MKVLPTLPGYPLRVDHVPPSERLARLFISLQEQPELLEFLEGFPFFAQELATLVALLQIGDRCKLFDEKQQGHVTKQTLRLYVAIDTAARQSICKDVFHMTYPGQMDDAPAGVNMVLHQGESLLRSLKISTQRKPA